MLYLLKAIVASEPETAVYRKSEFIFDRLRRRDRYYEGHIRRTCSYALDFARLQGLSETELQQLYLATLFHDIGKAMIPAQLINKQAPLSAAEHRVLRTHPALGEKICLDLGLLEEIAVLVGSHHERPNGTGYPKGLEEDGISELARILAVIEIYDALRSTRSYKLAFSQEKSLEILNQNAARGNLDKNVVEQFARFVEKKKNRQMLPDSRIAELQSTDAEGRTLNVCRRPTL